MSNWIVGWWDEFWDWQGDAGWTFWVLTIVTAVISFTLGYWIG